jgi:hypothetical protein
MLKDPRIEVERFSLPFENLYGDESVIESTSPILFSTFKVRDGRTAVVLTNWSSENRVAVVTVSPDELEVGHGGTLALLQDSNLTTVSEQWSDAVTLTLELAPYSTQALLATPASQRPRRPSGRRLSRVFQ